VGLRSPGDVDDRGVALALDVFPAPGLGVAVLAVGGEIGDVAVQAQLHHLPVALVQPDAAGELVVVGEVEEPVLQPQPPLGRTLAPRAAVHHVRVLRAHVQRGRLRAVVAVEHAEVIAAPVLLAVCVDRVLQEGE
jgi:hypothetical protein